MNNQKWVVLGIVLGAAVFMVLLLLLMAPQPLDTELGPGQGLPETQPGAATPGGEDAVPDGDEPQPPIYDIDGDGDVDHNDLTAFSSSPEDLDGDGLADANDGLLIVENYDNKYSCGNSVIGASLAVLESGTESGSFESGPGVSALADQGQEMDFNYLQAGSMIEVLHEECDDGNILSGDGCSSTCRIEEASSLASSCPVNYEPCYNADIKNDDDLINKEDFDLLLQEWGECESLSNCTADLDKDGQVGTTDLLILLGNWHTDSSFELIYTAQDLNATHYMPLNTNYRQMCNIDLSGTGAWEPIAGETGEFYTGTYDGNHKEISNLLVRSDDRVGMFGNLKGMIKDLRLVDSDVEGQDLVGGFVGYQLDTGIVSDSLLCGFVSGDRYVGGITGFLDSGVIESSVTTGSINGSFKVGGLAGTTVFSGKVTDSYSDAVVTGYNNTGGLVGFVDNAMVNYTYATGTVLNLNGLGGGLIGGNIGSLVFDSYWDMNTSGVQTSAGGEGRTTEEMTSVPRPANTYVGWAFNNQSDLTDTWTWDQEDGEYPWLGWQGGPL